MLLSEKTPEITAAPTANAQLTGHTPLSLAITQYLQMNSWSELSTRIKSAESACTKPWARNAELWARNAIQRLKRAFQRQ